MGEKMNVIFPSATVVPEELQKLGKLPAIIYPINQKIAFDYLYDQYKDVCEKMVVVCHEKADKVHRRLKNYRDKRIELADLPELSDLGHSVYFAIREMTDPVIINFADTIVLDDIIKLGENSYYYTEDFLSDTWTYFEEEEGKIISIYDKKASESNVKAKLFVGVFKIACPVYFTECLEKAFEAEDRTESTFYYALRLYSEKYPLSAIATENWFDIGHADKYYNSKLEVRAREFNHITIDKNRGILRKTSDDKDKLIGEIKWYLKLPTDIEYVSPRIFDYSTSYTEPYVSMEYYAYHTVHELFLYGDLGQHQWTDLFKRIQFVCHDFKRYQVKDDGIKAALEDMYLCKTKQRFDRMKKDENFVQFFQSPIRVNGVLYKPLDKIMQILEKNIPRMLYDVESFHIIHGDLCFANIMVDPNLSFIKVIDPRGKFGKYDIYGDSRYELAKLFHSVDGKYDFIIKDLFEVEYNADACQIDYHILDRKRDFDIYHLFLDVFSEEIKGDLNKIELIEALLFLSMIPLHGESIRHQMVMLSTGLEILNRVLDIEEG